MDTQKKTLHLILKKKWFDMIASGEKKEEYRDQNGWMKARLYGPNGKKRRYDTITFQHGYQPNSTRVELKYEGFSIGTGKPEWGAEPGTEYFVIKLGERIGNG